jgi:hypothetical protein
MVTTPEVFQLLNHATPNGERSVFVDAGRRALEAIDRTKLWNGVGEGINAGRKRTGQRLRRLSGRKGVNVVEGAEKICARKIVKQDR